MAKIQQNSRPAKKMWQRKIGVNAFKEAENLRNECSQASSSAYFRSKITFFPYSCQIYLKKNDKKTHKNTSARRIYVLQHVFAVKRIEINQTLSKCGGKASVSQERYEIAHTPLYI
ncbi:MAG: hypothetical protein IJV06_05875 [Bacteroidaceae bacterium]|nr:hypothetical protein [Bacteroidaceae bacterium]